MKILIVFTESEMKETTNLALDMCDDLDQKLELIKALETKTVSVKNNIFAFNYNKNKKYAEFELDEAITIATINLSKFFFAKIKDFVLTAFDKVKGFVNMIDDKAGKTVTIIDGKNVDEETEKDPEHETKAEETTNEKENENKSE